MKVVSKIKNLLLLLPMVAGVALTQSCTENIDTSARYTFTGNTIMSYLEEYPDVYGEYCTMLDSVNISEYSNSTLSQLLTARGNYTCFAPTNEAIHAYLQHLVDTGFISIPSWDAPEFQEVNPVTNKRELLESVRQTIVYNSLFDHGDDEEAFQTSDFSEYLKFELPIQNMRNRNLTIDQDATTKQFIIGNSPISSTNCNIFTINGRIHQIEKVIAPSEKTVGSFFTEVKNNNIYGYKIYSVLLDTCGLIKELSQHEDLEYYRGVMNGSIKADYYHTTEHSYGFLPEHRYYGYTVFAEDDNWWANELGLTQEDILAMTSEQITEAVYNYVLDKQYHLEDASRGSDFEDINNALNQFVTYHLIPAKIGPGKLVIHHNELWYQPDTKTGKGNIVYEYFTSMGKRRLIKTYEAEQTWNGEKDVIWINRFPQLNNGRNVSYVTEKACDSDKEGVKINLDNVEKPINGYIYSISGCLYFNKQTSENMGTERIRMDASSLLKELLSCDIRAKESTADRHNKVRIPSSNVYNFFDDLEIGDKSYFFYLNGRQAHWMDYQGDEWNVVGNYELTFKLPPVPKDGTYELRIGVQANDQRGMCQVYWGTNKNALPAAGIPFDMRMGGEQWFTKAGTLQSTVGWAKDEEDEEVNIEIEKQMRNKGYMKAPNSIYTIGTKQTMRTVSKILRRIIIREEMKKDETYYIQFKSVLDDINTQFFFDYIEFCPKEVYDNPLTPEDIW
ncbi:MAG: fasciclin domain-containing protein [Bacteroidaceae bacterium]|nr:fasciclin domain-containing protein [Bacteroidaceae bacterium]